MFWYAKDTIEVTYKNMQNIKIYYCCGGGFGVLPYISQIIDHNALCIHVDKIVLFHSKRTNSCAHNYVYILYYLNIL